MKNIKNQARCKLFRPKPLTLTLFLTTPMASYDAERVDQRAVSVHAPNVTARVARLAFFMPTFSNVAYCKVVGSKKNHLLAFQPKVPTRDFYCQPIQNMPNLRKLA